MNRSEFFEKLKQGAKWDVGVSINRTNPLPLDANEIFESVAKMETYIKGNPLAYPGQIVVVLDEVTTSGESVTPVTTSVVASAYLINVVGGEGKGYIKLAATTGSGDVGEELTALAARVAANESNISDLTTKIQPIDGLSSKVEDHETRLTSVESKTAANESSIKNLTTKVETNEKSISGNASEITAIKSNTYTKTEVENLISQQAHLTAKVVESVDDMTATAVLYLIKDETAAGDDKYKEYLVIDGTPTLIGDTSTNLSGYATSKSVEDIKADLEQAKQDITSKDAAMGQRVDGVADDLTEFKTSVASTYQTVTKAGEDKAALEETINSKANDADFKALKTTVEGHTSSIEALQAVDTNLGNRIQALEDVGAQKNVINSVDTTEFSIDDSGKLSVKEIAQSKITGLTAELATKITDPKNGSRLITEDESKKLEKLVLNDDGSVEVSGEVAAGNVKGLGEWITTHRDDTTGLFSSTDATTLAGIEKGAQVNKIEAFTIANNDVIENKKVNIPIAGAQLGVVLSSAEQNNVKVGADGTMTVNDININKLVQPEDVILVLDGGNA